MNKDNQETVFDDIAMKDALFNADIPIIIFRLSPFGILYINKIFEKEWGLDADILLKEPARLVEVVYESDKPEFIRKVIENPLGNCYEHIEFRIVMPDNHQKWYVLNLYPLWIQKKLKGTIGFAQGMTEGKQKEITPQTCYDKMEDYIHMIKHELKGKVCNIGIIVNLIKQKADIQDRAKLIPYLHLITEIYQEILSYTEDLSNNFFMEAAEFQAEEAELTTEIFEVIDIYRAQLEDRKLIVKVEMPKGKVRAIIDRIKFRQMLKNLLANAIKFSHEKGHITVTLESKEKDILLAVKDTGIGIPAPIQPFIFEKHSRAMRKGTKGEHPSGLGTYIMKRMVDIHNGEVWFESEEGVGTTFYVKIPKQPA